jgi:nicotinate-nucleotide pyrophosphorylase (carboxylating)
MPQHEACRVQLICKQDGVLAGIDVYSRVFRLLDAASEFESNYKDGDILVRGTLVGVLRSDVVRNSFRRTNRFELPAAHERIASMTKQYTDELAGTKTKLLDTRKTTPNMRLFEKYAVKVGGGVNHRYNLSDGILIKDNHIDAAGSIRKAVEAAREYAPFVRKIEVEAETLEMVKEALIAKADIIMRTIWTPQPFAKQSFLSTGRLRSNARGMSRKTV